MSYLLLLSIKGRTDLRNILSEYGSLQCDPKELYRIFKTATEKKGDELPFLKVDCCACHDDVKFSRDFTQFIYHVDFNSVITLEGVAVPVKNITNVCINTVADAFTWEAILAIPPTANIVRTVPFTVIPVQ